MASGWTLPDLLKMDSIFPHAPLKGSAAQRATRRFLEFTLIAGALGFSIPIIALAAFLVIGALSLGSSTPKQLLIRTTFHLF